MLVNPAGNTSEILERNTKKRRGIFSKLTIETPEPVNVS